MEKSSLAIHRGIIIRGTCSETSEIFENTKKPQKLAVSKWVRRIKNINSLIPMMGEEKLKEEKLVKNVISPNQPDLWIKPFHLSGAHQYNNAKKVMSTSEVLENNEQMYPFNLRNPNRNKSNKTNSIKIGKSMQASPTCQGKNTNGRILSKIQRVKTIVDIWVQVKMTNKRKAIILDKNQVKPKHKEEKASIAIKTHLHPLKSVKQTQA